MSILSFLKGRRFEKDVEERLKAVEREYPDRVSVRPQEAVRLRDSRTKAVDFSFSYKTLSSEHLIAVECQHRSRWSSEVLDKILAIRANSYRNRFWFVYRTDDFLSRDTKRMLDDHGVLHFSIGGLQGHLNNIRSEMQAAELELQRRKRYSFSVPSFSEPRRDPAMISRR